MPVRTPSTLRRDFADMLTYARPHGSSADLEFRRRFLSPLPGIYEDTHGNLHVRQGADDQANRVLWSCHTDTVHRTAGRQAIVRAGDLYGLPKNSKSNCLGADDTVGVWLLVQLIRRGVPGHYVFHYGEEVGGLGSSALARTNAEWLARFPCAIALDRAGEHDIITHQAGWRTASDQFAASLGKALGKANPALTYRAEPGVYTDTAEYADLIPECTNLSVGYAGQHSKHEIADFKHACELLDALTALDPRDLTITRDPAKPELEYDARQITWDLWREKDDRYDYARWDDHGWKRDVPPAHGYLTDEYRDVQDALAVDRYLDRYADRYDQITAEDRESLWDYQTRTLRYAAESYYTPKRAKAARPRLVRGSQLLNKKARVN